ncbi:MAG TPA: DEAD/DEAH box helicase [Nitrososphaerales archaeon]|nr:DEAD/DEAH box helicase [Nitrososphaerales archaeon]
MKSAELPERKSTPAATYCQNCGTPAGQSERFCSKCGTWIRRRSVPIEPAREQNARIRVAPQILEPDTSDEALPPFALPSSEEKQTDSDDASLVRPLNEIKEEVESSGLDFETLPAAAKRILASREHYLVKYKLLEGQEADYGRTLDEIGIHAEIASPLERLGSERLYRFQEDAMLSILKGENAVVAAPTGNGKTIAFAVPIFHKILLEKEDRAQELGERREVRALFIYPTKALARDQLRMLESLRGRISLGVFDGDTPSNERQKILDLPPDVIISNFDTVEYHLRNNTHFAELLRTVRYVVVDELHTYVGAFGTHVHFILRRLRRILRDPEKLQLVGSSATIRNPKQFAEQLFNSTVSEVRCENGRRGRIHFVMLYPTKISMTSMMASSVRYLLSSGMKTLVFANTHKNAEVLNLALRHSGIPSEIHRSGLLKSQRVEVEDSFKSGLLKSLVATPTLELGIDIGDLDSVVSMITGITNLTQRMGRAGRKGQESVVVLAMRGEDPISAYYRNHPDTYFADISPAYVEPSNPIIARLEILAASMDRPISPSKEFQEFSPLIQSLVEQKFLIERLGRLWPTNLARTTVNEMNIRGIGESVTILDSSHGSNRIVGERQLPMALRELFPHAVYLLGGRKYQSVSFENRGGIRTAKVKRLPDSHQYKTEALRYSLPKIIDVLEKKGVKGVEAQYCSLTMTEVVEGYVAKEIFTDKRVGPNIMLPKPLSYTYQTKGFVFHAPTPVNTLSSKKEEKEGSSGDDEEDILGGSFHALEHALIEGSDSLTGSGSSEVGGVSMGDSGVIFVYDGSPGGSGLTKLLYDRLDEAFERTLSILKECKCTSKDGCPLCTYSYQCGNNNDPLNKIGAIESLQLILESKSRSKEVVESDYKEKKSYL